MNCNVMTTLSRVALVVVTLVMAASAPDIGWSLPLYADDPSSLDLIHEIDALTLKSKPALQLPAPTKKGDEVQAEGRFCDEDAPEQCVRFFITPDTVAVGNTQDGFVFVDKGKTGRPQFAMTFQDNDDWLSGTAVPIAFSNHPRADSEYRSDLSLVLECLRTSPPPAVTTQGSGN